jgi:hypothetical protein
MARSLYNNWRHAENNRNNIPAIIAPIAREEEKPLTANSHAVIGSGLGQDLGEVQTPSQENNPQVPAIAPFTIVDPSAASNTNQQAFTPPPTQDPQVQVIAPFTIVDPHASITTNQEAARPIPRSQSTPSFGVFKKPIKRSPTSGDLKEVKPETTTPAKKEP